MINSVFLSYPKKNLYNCLKSQAKMWLGLSSSKTDYKLLEKTKKLSVDNFPKDSWALPTEADKYTRVRIGKKTDKNYEREVVTFYNSKGDMIRRCFRGTDMKNKMREYTKDFFLPRKDTELNGALGVNKTRIKTSEFFPVDAVDQNLGEWKTVSDEEQFVYSMFDKIKENRSAKKLHINKNQYDYNGEKAHVRATCVEYPINLGFENPKDKKILSVQVGIENNRAKIESVNHETNVEVPLNDKYLPYRMLVGNKKQECLAQHFLDEKDIGDLGILIETNKSKVNSNASAYFSSQNREIVFKDVQKYANPVSTAAHEAEHAYQYSMIGRLGRIENYFEKKCYLDKGPLNFEYERIEARKYAEARDNYPKLSPKEDLSKNKDYQNNYLEQKARLASKLAIEIYEVGRQKLLNVFKYVGGYSSF